MHMYLPGSYIPPMMYINDILALECFEVFVVDTTTTNQLYTWKVKMRQNL